MGYIAGTLSTGEEILLEPKLHWCNYSKAILSSALSLFIIYLLFFIPAGKVTTYVTGPVLLIALGLSLGYTLMEIMRNSFIELACTNKRVIQKRGIIRRVADELLVSKVESLEVKQSILGRILGYGNLHFSGTGTSKADFLRVKNPLETKALAADILEKYKD